MSDDTTQTRREFVVGAIAVGGGLVSLSIQRSAFGEVSEPRLVLFDAQHAGACRLSSAEAGCTRRAIVGDRVRFAKEIFGSASAPDVMAGFTNYADFIVLSGCAAEHGYRVIREETSHALVAWTVARRQR